MYIIYMCMCSLMENSIGVFNQLITSRAMPETPQQYNTIVWLTQCKKYFLFIYKLRYIHVYMCIVRHSVRSNVICLMV